MAGRAKAGARTAAPGLDSALPCIPSWRAKLQFNAFSAMSKPSCYAMLLMGCPIFQKNRAFMLCKAPFSAHVGVPDVGHKTGPLCYATVDCHSNTASMALAHCALFICAPPLCQSLSNACQLSTARVALPQ